MALIYNQAWNIKNYRYVWNVSGDKITALQRLLSLCGKVSKPCMLWLCEILTHWGLLAACVRETDSKEISRSERSEWVYCCANFVLEYIGMQRGSHGCSKEWPCAWNIALLNGLYQFLLRHLSCRTFPISPFLGTAKCDFAQNLIMMFAVHENPKITCMSRNQVSKCQNIHLNYLLTRCVMLASIDLCYVAPGHFVHPMRRLVRPTCLKPASRM